MTPERVERTYLTLTLLQTLAASLIWGVNTLFLLDAGLSLTEAFVANGAFTAGMVLFEIPTGVIADSFGRRRSFLLGAATLLVATAGYLGLWAVSAGIGWWILVSALIGLGFTFFSGATEAWLVDALDATGYTGSMERVFGRGGIVAGGATLLGTIGGGLLGQLSLGYPYVARSVLLGLVVVVAAFSMHDIGFSPGRRGRLSEEVSNIFRASVEHGLRNRPVRLFMLAAPFGGGVGIWAFYAFQPYLLDLFGDPNATWLSGVAAAVFATSQMVGGALVPWVRRRVSRRTTVLLAGVVIFGLGLIGVGLAAMLPMRLGFWLAIALLAATMLASSTAAPMRQAYLNAVIPTQQRATVLSFDSLASSLGGVGIQPGLGRIGDVYSLGTGYVVAGIIYLLELPFMIRVRGLKLPADDVVDPRSDGEPYDVGSIDESGGHGDEQ